MIGNVAKNILNYWLRAAAKKGAPIPDRSGEGRSAPLRCAEIEFARD